MQGYFWDSHKVPSHESTFSVVSINGEKKEEYTLFTEEAL